MRPKREPATNNRQTYMVTSETWGRRPLFRAEPWARLFVETLYHYRGSGYLLHEFVVMPDHFHALITPTGALERAVQLIKGGFSFRAKKEWGSNLEIWEVGFSDHRIRDLVDYETHVAYIRMNPVRKHLAGEPHQYQYSSGFQGFHLDEVPQELKPLSHGVPSGGPKGPPFQNEGSIGARDVEPVDDSRSAVGAASSKSDH